MSAGSLKMDEIGNQTQEHFFVGQSATIGLVLLSLSGLVENFVLIRLLLKPQIHIDPMIKRLLILETASNFLLSFFQSKCFFVIFVSPNLSILV